MSQDQVSFKVTPQESFWIHSIAMKAARKFKIDLLEIEMDITACHANGNPLRLRKLLVAKPFDFTHDVLGIRQHLDRNTGKLKDNFLPRYSE